jgi:hypothetical protein
MMGAPEQRHPAGGARGLRQRRAAHRHVRVDQRGQQAQQRQQHGERGGQRLREEEVGEHREEAQEEDDEGVAPRPQLQRLERQQHTIERHARVAAEQRAVRGVGGGQRHRQQRDAPPRPGSGRACTASVARHSSTMA